jgi:hypothetical protein
MQSQDSQFSRSSSEAPNENEFTFPSWWQTMLTRRQMNANLLGLAASVGVSGFFVSCDDDDIDSESDTLELQRKEGWNVGSQDKSLTFPHKQIADSSGSTAWKDYTKPETLLQAWQPTSAGGKWQPYFVPTLIQSLSQDSLRGTMAPIFTPSMQDAYSRGLGMREILQTSSSPSSTLIISDLAGPESVAFAAALADVAEPVLNFDNFPHPLGVVPSHETLAALIYYAAEVKKKSSARPENPAAIIVADARRLAQYVDADSQFDNRYMAKLPTAENLQNLGVSAIVYAVPNEQQINELDDLNEEFASYQERNISVEMLPITRFQPDASGAGNVSAENFSAPAERQDSTVQNAYAAQRRPPVYYYGGSPMFSPWFFYHYPVYSYYRALPVMTSLPASNLSRRPYTPVRRPTIFTARAVGGASGIGKQRPSGFGRVSVRTSASTGRLSGIRSGRSGSFGRSSFGGSS